MLEELRSVMKVEHNYEWKCSQNYANIAAQKTHIITNARATIYAISCILIARFL